MINIIIYTRPEVLLHKMGMGYNPDDESDEAFGTNCEFLWTLNNRPDDIDKVFFATKGFIIGYFEVEECDEDDEDFSWVASSWTLLENPIPTKSFQGFKYADKVPELSEYIKEKSINGCGKKFEFIEGDNIYDGVCGEDDDGLCKECSQSHGNQHVKSRGKEQ